MTLAEIELDIYRRLDYADTPPASVKSRIDSFINQRHRELLAHDRMRPLRLATTTLVSVPNRGSYGLPFGCARVHRVMDLDNDTLLGTQTYEWLRSRDPDPTGATGRPEVWIPVGFSPVAARPIYTEAPGLWMASIDDPPGTSLTFTLVVIGQGGEHLTVYPVLNAVDPTIRNPVALPTNFVPHDIASFSSNKILDGAVALFDTSTAQTGNLISQISKGQTTARYYRIALAPRPGAEQSYQIDYEREIPELRLPLDEPLLPLDFHDLIAMLARLDEYEFKSDDRWPILQRQIQKRTVELRAWIDNHDIYRQHAILTVPTRTSRLGYPGL